MTILTSKFALAAAIAAATFATGISISSDVEARVYKGGSLRKSRQMLQS